MNQETPSFLALYRALDFERPLDISNPTDEKLYVKNLHLSQDYDPIADLCANVEMAQYPGTWLFTGHRGVGKSTELRRMAHDLRQQGFTVWIVDILDYLNPAEPLTIEGLLLNIGAALADEAERQGLQTATLNQGPAARLWYLFKNTTPDLPEISAQMSLGAGASISIKSKLQHNPDLRQRILNSVRSAPAKLAGQVRTFAAEIAEASQKSHAQNTSPPVLIIDSLEKLRISGVHAQECYDAIVNTFDIHGEHLKLEHLHVVYSVPPYLPFLCPGIGGYFGVEICTLPHVKIFETPQNTATPDTPAPLHIFENGVALLVSCAQQRYSAIETLIPEAQIEDLAIASSGSVRDFFRLLRSVCTKAHAARAPAPLTDTRLGDLAKQSLRNEMPLTSEDKAWLRRVRISHGTELDSVGNLHQLARLFDNGLILNYRNGTDWCEVQYLLHDLL